MIVIDAPIRGLSNQVTLHTANAVKEFFELCQAADPKSGYMTLPPWLQEKVVSINNLLTLIVGTQKQLIDQLELVSSEHLATPGFQKVIGDLERAVSQVDSAISDTSEMPDSIVKLWKPNLETVAQQNSHIDNYVESFRISFDETCSALLADLATKISENRANA
jgi:enhancing lycopene biosynthesis protein 2